jgi:hypothetical protein
MTKIYKVTLYLTDHEDIGEEDLKFYLINDIKYVSTVIGEIKSITIDRKDWSDDHELNQVNADYEKYFKE